MKNSHLQSIYTSVFNTGDQIFISPIVKRDPKSGDRTFGQVKVITLTEPVHKNQAIKSEEVSFFDSVISIRPAGKRSVEITLDSAGECELSIIRQKQKED